MLSAETDMIDTKTAASILGVHPDTVRRWRKDGVFTTYRVGNGVKPRIRFKRSEIEHYLNTHIE